MYDDGKEKAGTSCLLFPQGTARDAGSGWRIREILGHLPVGRRTDAIYTYERENHEDQVRDWFSFSVWQGRDVGMLYT
jgi:hypothetical protein